MPNNDLRPALLARSLAGALALLLSAGSAQAATTFLCGEVYDAGAGGGEPNDLPNHGIHIGQRYAARLDLTDRPPDLDTGTSTEWDCTTPGFECGDLQFRFEGFRPPQTIPYPAPLLGRADASAITRTQTTYRLGADLDDFVPFAIGIMDMTILCFGTGGSCWTPTDIQSPGPQHPAVPFSTAGEVAIQMQVPGIGQQPMGTLHDLRMTVDSFAEPSCRRDYLLLRGDFDDDADVDLGDDQQFGACYTGNGGGPVSELCLRGDFDEDLDIDCVDRVGFMDRWTEGESPPPISPCDDIPTLPGWGGIGMGALLVAAGGIAGLLRARRVAAAGGGREGTQ